MTREHALDSIKDYLTAGGLFNPELMDHAAVRDLIIECRDALEAHDDLLRQAVEALQDLVNYHSDGHPEKYKDHMSHPIGRALPVLTAYDKRGK